MKGKARARAAVAKTSSSTITRSHKINSLIGNGAADGPVSAETIIHRGADMAVCGADENVAKVLRSMGFNEIVGLYPDFTSAAAVLIERRAEFKNRTE